MPNLYFLYGPWTSVVHQDLIPPLSFKMNYWHLWQYIVQYLYLCRTLSGSSGGCLTVTDGWWKIFGTFNSSLLLLYSSVSCFLSSQVEVARLLFHIHCYLYIYKRSSCIVWRCAVACAHSCFIQRQYIYIKEFFGESQKENTSLHLLLRNIRISRKQNSF